MSGQRSRPVPILICILACSLLWIAGCTEQSVKKTTNTPGQGSEPELQGESVTLDPSGSGTAAIPWVNPLGIFETDVKHHWDMPEGKIKVFAQLVWEDTSWEFEFSIGTGECPHSGQKLAGDSGATGNLTVEYEADSDGTLETGQWFAHVATLNDTEHRGQSTSYTATVIIYSAPAPTSESPAA